MSNYFKPLIIGDLELPNRIVMPSLTRARSTPDGVPTDVMGTYYRQRASAGLILAEATKVNDQSQAFELSPGIHSKEQIAAWKKVTDQVHEDGGRIFSQLWHCGRVGASYTLKGREPMSPSGVNDDPALLEVFGKLESGGYVKMHPTASRAMTKDEIKQTIADYGQAAKNAMDSGFDGIEIHAANGYLPNQFLCDRLNRREDEYGGSIENRSRIVSEIFEACLEHVPAKRIGVRFSPYASYNNATPSDTHELYSYLSKRMEELGAAYIHFADMDAVFGSPHLDKILAALRPNYTGPIIGNGGLSIEQADSLIADGLIQAAAFGRMYISNPDLVERIRDGAEIAETLYHKGMYAQGAYGYSDYPTHEKEPETV